MKNNNQSNPSSSKNQPANQVAPLLLILAGVIMIGAVIFISLSQSSTQAVGPVRIGQALGDFSLQDINGKTVRLGDYKGKAVLINAWATWCPPCKAEMPLLNAYYQAHVDEGFVLLAINAGDTLQQAASFANQTGLAFPVLLDPASQLLKKMGISSFPTSILIGRDGKVKAIQVGIFTESELHAKMSPLLD